MVAVFRTQDVTKLPQKVYHYQIRCECCGTISKRYVYIPRPNKLVQGYFCSVLCLRTKMEERRLYPDGVTWKKAQIESAQKAVREAWAGTPEKPNPIRDVVDMGVVKEIKDVSDWSGNPAARWWLLEIYGGDQTAEQWLRNVEAGAREVWNSVPAGAFLKVGNLKEVDKKVYDKEQKALRKELEIPAPAPAKAAPAPAPAKKAAPAKAATFVNETASIIMQGGTETKDTFKRDKLWEFISRFMQTPFHVQIGTDQTICISQQFIPAGSSDRPRYPKNDRATIAFNPASAQDSTVQPNLYYGNVIVLESVYPKSNGKKTSKRASSSSTTGKKTTAKSNGSTGPKTTKSGKSAASKGGKSAAKPAKSTASKGKAPAAAPIPAGNPLANVTRPGVRAQPSIPTLEQMNVV